MKQKIAKNRRAAIKFAEAGNKNSQRAAYWKERDVCYRAERLPGEKMALIREGVGGYAWSAHKTIAKKIEEANHAR